MDILYVLYWYTVMSISVQWLNDDQNVIHFKYEGNWDWEEFYETLIQADQMRHSVEHLVHHIYDMNHSDPLPSGALSQFSILRKRDFSNLGISILVSPNGFYSAFYQLMERLYPGIGTKFSIVSMLEEALKKLEQVTLDEAR